MSDFYKVSNHLSAAGAQALAERLQRYWATRGFKILAYVEEQKVDKQWVYVVRSDIVRGLPTVNSKTAQGD